jgi:hypothetical protein
MDIVPFLGNERAALFGPFDQHHAVTRKIIVAAGGIEFAGIAQAIKIEMKKGRFSLRVFIDESK